MRRGLLLFALLILAVSGLALAQETTPDPVPSTDLPSLTPTASETPTATLSPVATDTPIPTAPPSETPHPPTDTPTLFPTDSPAPETTPETTPPVESTPESTEPATETPTPTATGTASATPLPAEPAWVLISSAGFETGAPPPEWRFDSEWTPQLADGLRVYGPRSFGGSALFAHPPLTDTAVQLRARLSNGVFAFGLRQSEAGGYTATFDEAGFLRLFRGEQEVGQAFLGPIAGQWRTLRLAAAGDVVRVSLDGAELITFVDPSPLSAGVVTLGGWRSIGSRFAVDDLSVWAAEGEAVMAAPAAFAAPMAFGTMNDPLAGRITSTLAYTVEENYFTHQIVLIASDGSETVFPGLQLAGSKAWSPDGQWLLVHADNDRGVRVFNPFTGEIRVLTSTPLDPYYDDGSGARCPAWSPDGTRIVFQSLEWTGGVDEHGMAAYHVGLYTMGVDGQSAPARIALSGAQEYFGCPEWTTVGDGQQVLVSVAPRYGYDGTSQLQLVSAQSGQVVPVFEAGEQWLGQGALSPDGRRVVFTLSSNCGCTQTLHVLDLPSGQLTDVVSEPLWHVANSPSWNGDGTRMAFPWLGPERPELIVADLTLPCPSCSLTSPFSEYINSPIWSPDSQWIAGADYPWGLRLLAAEGGEIIQITANETRVTSVSWQPLPVCAAEPGAVMAFSSNGITCEPPRPTPSPAEWCMGYPVDGDSSNVRMRPEIVHGNEIGAITTSGRRLLARWTVGTIPLWDDWYLVAADDGVSRFGWSRADVVYTSPRYRLPCALPVWNQVEAPETNAALPITTLRPQLPRGFVAEAASLFIPAEVHAELRLPAPFEVTPADDGATLRPTQGYGLNTYAFLYPSYYDGTNHIHSGLDFFYTESVESIGQACAAGGRTYPNGECFRIRAVCDGLVYAVSDPLPTDTGRRLSLRCTAPDGSLSNLYVVYNHLRVQVSDNEFVGGEWVSAGDMLGGLRVFPYVTAKGVTSPHLHLEVFYHRGLYFSPETPGTIRLNPLVFFNEVLIQQIRSRMDPYYPTDSFTATGDEKRYEWPNYDVADPNDIYAERGAYTRNDPDAPEDYDLGIDPLYNGAFTCLGDTFPPVSDPVDAWFREDDYPGIQQLGLTDQPETPSQVIRSWSDLILRLQQGQ